MHEIDETRVKEKHEHEIVLAHLPKVLWVKIEKCQNNTLELKKIGSQ